MFSQSHGTYFLCCDTVYENSFEQVWTPAMSSVDIINDFSYFSHALIVCILKQSQWYIYFPHVIEEQTETQ